MDVTVLEKIALNTERLEDNTKFTDYPVTVSFIIHDKDETLHLKKSLPN